MSRTLYKIDPKYDVVLTYSPIIEITGHLFECFDYYLFLREKYTVGILLFDGLPEAALRTAFESKYAEPFDSVLPDLMRVDGAAHGKDVDVYVPFRTFLLMTDGNFKAAGYNGIHFIAKRLFGFLCEPDPGDLLGMPKNIVYLQDYRIYGRNSVHCSIDYVKKLPFRHYRKCADVDPKKGMMYMTYVCRKVDPDTVLKYFQMSGCDSAMLVTPYPLKEYDGISGITQVTAPVSRFFDRFGTYIYLPVARRLDCSSRLAAECALHGKNMFMDLEYSDLALETRMADIKRDVQSLNLKEGDRILDVIEEYRRT